jgi:KUP system potassium uptake protein
LHERIVLVSVEILDIPRRGRQSSRVAVVRLADNFWQVRVFYGFMEQPNLPEALEGCADYGLTFDPMDTSFFLGRETLMPRLHSEMWSSWRGKIFVGNVPQCGQRRQLLRSAGQSRGRVGYTGGALALQSAHASRGR